MRLIWALRVAVIVSAVGSWVLPDAMTGYVSGSSPVRRDETAEAATRLQWIDHWRPSLRHLVDINAIGDVAGANEVWEARSVLQRVAFFRRGNGELTMPLVTGYTQVEATALSDNGLVVGFAGRIPRFPGGGLQAFIWSVHTRESKGLGWLSAHNSSFAYDISADGSLVTGYSVGANPTRMVPCVWQVRDGVWRCSRLPTPKVYNPFVLTSRVVVSDDGMKIAACVLQRQRSDDGEPYTNQLCLWERQSDGTWNSTRLYPRGFRLADINNAGMLAGTSTETVNTAEGRPVQRLRAFVYDTRAGFKLLGVLPGDVSSTVTDLNNGGVVVGYSDDPDGPDGGAEAFVWCDGSLSRLVLPTDCTFSAATAINDTGQIAGYVEKVRPGDQTRLNAAFVVQLKQTFPGR